jgi:hypothetical protein
MPGLISNSWLLGWAMYAGWYWLCTFYVKLNTLVAAAQFQSWMPVKLQATNDCMSYIADYI